MFREKNKPMKWLSINMAGSNTTASDTIVINVGQVIVQPESVVFPLQYFNLVSFAIAKYKQARAEWAQVK